MKLPEELEQELLEILKLETFESKMTGEDFQEQAVWVLKKALTIAFNAGRSYELYSYHGR